MRARNLLLTTWVATISSSLLTGTAAADAAASPKATVATERGVETPSFRAEIESYVREVNERVRTTLSEDLKRELRRTVVMGSDGLRTRG